MKKKPIALFGALVLLASCGGGSAGTSEDASGSGIGEEDSSTDSSLSTDAGTSSSTSVTGTTGTGTTTSSEIAFNWPAEEIASYLADFIGYEGSIEVPVPSGELDAGRTYEIGVSTSDAGYRFIAIEAEGDMSAYEEEALAYGGWEKLEGDEYVYSTVDYTLHSQDGALEIRGQYDDEDDVTFIRIYEAADFHFDSWPEDFLASSLKDWVGYEGEASFPSLAENPDGPFIVVLSVLTDYCYEPYVNIISGNVDTFSSSSAYYAAFEADDNWTENGTNNFKSQDDGLKAKFSVDSERGFSNVVVYNLYGSHFPTELMSSYLASWVGYEGDAILPTPSEALSDFRYAWSYGYYTSNSKNYFRITVKGDFSAYRDQLAATDGWYWYYGTSGSYYYHSEDLQLEALITDYDSDSDSTTISLFLKTDNWYGYWTSSLFDELIEEEFGGGASLPELPSEYFTNIYAYIYTSQCIYIYIYTDDTEETADVLEGLFDADENFTNKYSYTNGPRYDEANGNYSLFMARYSSSTSTSRVTLQIRPYQYWG